MTERPPNEVAAALRDTSSYPSFTRIKEAANLIDRLTRERDEWKTKWDSCDDAWQKEWERAETAERELSEARASEAQLNRILAESVCDRDEARAALAKAERNTTSWKDECHDAEEREGETEKRAEAAEAACLEHAEAIGVLREAAAKVAQDYAIDHAEDHGTPAVAHNAAMNIRDAIRALPIPELAAQVERERRAEREVVRAARAWAIEDQKEADGERSHIGGASTALREALAALPASHPGVIDK